MSIGDAVRLKKNVEDLRRELTPAFQVVIDSYLGKPVTQPLANPDEFFENTVLTDALKLFIKRVTEGLSKPGPTVLPLIFGFGFGKTHAQIFLLHAFLSSKKVPEKIAEELLRAGWTEDLAESTLVLSIDFFPHPDFEPPQVSLAKILRAYGTHSSPLFKGDAFARRLSSIIEKYGSPEALDSTKFAGLVTEISKRTNFKLLVLVDELGLGVSKRITKYIEDRSSKGICHEELLMHGLWLVSFLSTLAENSNREGIPTVIVHATAQQDLDLLQLRAAEDEKIRSFYQIFTMELFQRLARYSGGIVTSALGFDPNDMIKIASFRILKPTASFERDKSKSVQALSDLGSHLGVIEHAKKDDFSRDLENIYPLAPSMVRAIRKLARSDDLPGTEYIRSAIYTLALAASNALREDELSPLIDVKHLPLEEACFLGYMGDVRQDWTLFVGQLVESIDAAPEKLRKACEHVAKLIASKGATARALDLIQVAGRESLEYATTLRDLRISVLCTTPLQEDVSSALEIGEEALRYLVEHSGRIEERHIDGEKYYFPSLLGTIFSKFQSLLAGEIKKAREKPLDYLRSSRLVTGILNAIKGETYTLCRISFDLLENPEKLLSMDTVKETLDVPRPIFLLVDPWDAYLSHRLNEIGFMGVLAEIANKMNDVKTISRPLYVFTLLPNLKEKRIMDLLLEAVAEYEASNRFLEYLEDKASMLSELMEKAFASTVVRRIQIKRSELQKIIDERIESEVGVANSAAQARMMRSARDVVVNLLMLYTRIIAYDVTAKAFVHEDTSKLVGRAIEGLSEVTSLDLSKYADIIGSFFEGIIGTRYVQDLNKLEEVVEADIRQRLEKGLTSELLVDDVVESLIQGVYGIVPLTGESAKMAVERLNGVTIELPSGRLFEIGMEEGVMKFKEVITGPPPPSPPPAESEGPLKSEIRLTGLDASEIRRLAQIIKSGGLEVKNIKVSSKTDDIEMSVAIKSKFEHIIPICNALASVLDKYGASADIQLLLEKGLAMDRIKAMFAETAEKMK
jgi:hypothetical protein